MPRRSAEALQVASEAVRRGEAPGATVIALRKRTPIELGYLKLPRQTFRPVGSGGDPFWNESRAFSRFEAWLDLQQLAAWGAHPFQCEGGEVIHRRVGETPPLSIRYLMKRWGWGSKKTVTAFLDRLHQRRQVRKCQHTKDGDTYHIALEGFTGCDGDSEASGYSFGTSDGYTQGDGIGDSYRVVPTSVTPPIGDGVGDTIGYAEGDSNGYKIKEEGKQEGKEEERKDTSVSSSGSDKPNPDGLSVREVFDYWREQSGHVKASLTDDRRKKIKARLRRFSVEQLRQAVDGACSNPFYAGDNEQGQRYDWPETIFKSDSAVEKHIAYTTDRKTREDAPGPVVELSDGTFVEYRREERVEAYMKNGWTAEEAYLRAEIDRFLEEEEPV